MRKSQILKSEGIVLKAIKYQETNAIVLIYNKFGLKSYLVKGVYKEKARNRALITPLTYLSFNFADTTNPLITEHTVIDNFSDLKLNIIKYNYALCLVEKILAFKEAGQDLDKLFPYFIASIKLIEKTDNYLAIVSLFDAKFLYIAGIVPSFKICKSCNNEAESGVFSIREAGVICKNCQNNFQYDLNTQDTSVLKYLYYVKLDNLSSIDLTYNYQNISEVVDKYYEYHIDFQSKVKKTLKNLL